MLLVQVILSKNKETFKEKLKIIDSLSVREEKIAEELGKILNQKIPITLDPALLLPRKDWEKYTREVNISKVNEKYILVYQIGKSKKFADIVDAFSDKSGYKVIHFERRASYKNKLFGAYDIGPFEFVNYIKNAEYVITTSFHATVFSILFNKKLWCVPLGGAGVRITDLLSKLHMKNRVINDVNDINKIDYSETIDYDSVQKLLEEERQKSINWLKGELEKQEVQ